MLTPLLVAGSGILCVSAVIAFVLTRRYNARFAMLMPLMGLVLAVGAMWQSGAGVGRPTVVALIDRQQSPNRQRQMQREANFRAIQVNLRNLVDAVHTI